MRAFAFSSERTWTELGLATQHRFAYPEIAATSRLMLDLVSRVPQYAVTLQTTARQESLNGADWEWWLTDGKEWLGLLVQAKIVNPRTGRYDKFNYKPRKAPKAQLALLIDAARSRGLYPLVLCYNYQAAPDFQWNCQTYQRRDPLYGCSVLLAPMAHQFAQTRQTSLKQVSAKSLPLMCLIGCRGRGGGALPGRAAAQISAAGDASVTEKLRQSPPSYVLDMLERRAGSDVLEGHPTDQTKQVLEELRLGGILVLKSPPDESIVET